MIVPLANPFPNPQNSSSKVTTFKCFGSLSWHLPPHFYVIYYIAISWLITFKYYLWLLLIVDKDLGLLHFHLYTCPPPHSLYSYITIWGKTIFSVYIGMTIYILFVLEPISVLWLYSFLQQFLVFPNISNCLTYAWISCNDC